MKMPLAASCRAGAAASQAAQQAEIGENVLLQVID
jgi:hypothetical protein